MVRPKLIGTLDYAAKEIILSAGAIDTPRILLLSGVGPAFELTDNGIPVVLDQPSIGKHLIDHPILRLAAPIKEGFIGLDSIPSHEGAKEQWLQDRTGPLGEDAAVSAHGYCKLDTSQYRGLQALDPAIQKHLTSPQTPTYEMLSVRLSFSSHQHISYLDASSLT
jgi:choline dehydrogenase-like flavoprotein